MSYHMIQEDLDLDYVLTKNQLDQDSIVRLIYYHFTLISSMTVGH